MAVARTLRIIQERNFVVVDGHRALLSSNESLSQLFNEDGTHYRPTANKVIADALRIAVKTRHLKETKPPGGGLVGWGSFDRYLGTNLIQ
jgi:histidinol-phosphate/aromatic aminotransferase/cobyric acid decarboxylase-like protein